MKTFDVNTDAAIALTAKLGKLHRSAFPVAVRGTLNNAAFETKEIVPNVAGKKFTTRQKGFFRAFSIVDQAKGFDLKKMRATVGINASKKDGEKVASGLEKQEKGGNIQGRKLIPMDVARTSEDYGKKIQRKNKFKKLGKTVRMRGGGSSGSTFIAKVMAAKKMGASNVIISSGGRGTLYRIIKTKRLKTRTHLSLKPLYNYRSSSVSRVKSTPFMKPSAMLASKKMNKFYRNQAERQFKRLLK